MQLLKAAFPLYAIRSFDEIYESAPYRLIQTKFKTYVLDELDTSRCFQERRLRLLTQDPGYPVYRLQERFTSIGQILHSKRKVFIDSNGKIVRLKREKYHKVTTSKVVRHERTWNGKFLLFTVHDSYVTDMVYNYISTIEVSGAKIFVGGLMSLDEARKSFRL
ncbi:hypothetical protein [Vibrio phage VCPH]|nr:hypothetical protein [Vibrio phage VCPH]